MVLATRTGWEVDRSPVPPDDVRDSMPRWLALPLTLLTGKPCHHQRPIRFTPTWHLANAVLSLAIGVLVSMVALTMGGWALAVLVVGWAVTLHGMRNLRMLIFHQCAHRNMWRKPRLDAAVGRVIATLLVVQQFDRYRAEHAGEHHSVHHMTLRDPTVQAMLLTLELRPGMSRARMWRRLLGKLLSPLFHLRFFHARVRSYVRPAGPVERVCAVVAVVLVLTGVHLLGGWVVFLVAWVVPLTVLFQISNTLRLCVKHTFPRPDQRDRRGRDYFAGLTNAIFLGERTPDRTAPPTTRLALWVRWWARLLLVHFPARYLVLTGDTVCHDFHHRHPMTTDWPNYIWAREADLETGGAPYRHAWGLVPAIDAVFASLAAADPDEYNAESVRSVSRRELFTAFDD